MPSDRTEGTLRDILEVKARHPDISWRQMAVAGNVYRHNYENVATQFV